MKTVLCILLAMVAALSLTAAFYVLDIPGITVSEPSPRGDTPYSDVKEWEWFSDSVHFVSQAGLMYGVGDNCFSPERNVTLTEVYTIAERLHDRYADAAESPDGFGSPKEEPWWYGLYNGVVVGEPGDGTQTVTRLECAGLLARVMPVSELDVVNIVQENAIPDLRYSVTDYSADVYRLYCAGVLTGYDEYGTFRPNEPVRRCEVAAIVARLIDPARRRTVSSRLTGGAA